MSRRGESTLTATPSLYSVAWGPVYDRTGETIILRGRGADRALIPYEDTRGTLGMRKEAAAVNEMLASTIIGVPSAIRVGNHLLFERLVTDRWGTLKVKRQFVRMMPGNGGRRIFSEVVAPWSVLLLATKHSECGARCHYAQRPTRRRARL